jgi:NADH-quinone oxidoreductase subunit M
MPLLASSFLLMGLALVGFPGTLGFVGQELLVEGSRGAGPYAGLFILLATALNGITLLRMYFRLFCGTRDRAPAEQSLRLRERIGFSAIVLLLVLGGLAPRAIVNRVTPSPSPPPATAPGPHR